MSTEYRRQLAHQVLQVEAPDPPSRARLQLLMAHACGATLTDNSTRWRIRDAATALVLCLDLLDTLMPHSAEELLELLAAEPPEPFSGRAVVAELTALADPPTRGLQANALMRLAGLLFDLLDELDNVPVESLAEEAQIAGDPVEQARAGQMRAEVDEVSAWPEDDKRVGRPDA